MKFTDIPKYTKRPSYHVNTEIDYIEGWIQNKIDELGLQMIPDFQRGHDWTKEQQIAYIEYLLRGGQSGRDFYFNRIGGFNDFRDTNAHFVCVDGLQRITAILAFLHNEIPVFGHYLKEFEEKLRFADVYFSMYVNDLSSKKDVLIWYLEMNSGGTPHKPEELEKVRNMIKSEV